YYQFIVNANGALYDSEGREDLAWTAQGVEAAAFVGDDFWSCELYVPYSAFDSVALPATGAQWFGNFTRHRVTDRSGREYQAFNVIPHSDPPSHNQNAFGPLPFIEN